MIEHVIVADDEAVQREGLVNIVKNLCPGVQVYECLNGMEAYRKLQEIQVDVILTDICMPIMDGMKLIQKVSKEYPGTRVILVSAFQEFEYAKKAIKYNCMEYLIKPFRVSEVKEVFDNVEEDIHRDEEKKRVIEAAQKNHVDHLMIDLLKGRIGAADKVRDKLKELNNPGVIVSLRWRSNPLFDDCETGYLSDKKKSFLLESIKKLFPYSYSIELPGGLVPMEEKQLFFLADVNPKEAEKKILECLIKFQQDYSPFWAGISDIQYNLLDYAPEAWNQAEEMLAFCFFEPITGGVYSYQSLNEVIENPLPYIKPYKKKLKRAVECGRKDLLVKELHELKNEFFRGKYFFPNKVKHLVSSMIISLWKELADNIYDNKFDSELNEAYKLYGECDSFDRLFDISEELLKKEMCLYSCMQKNNDPVDQCIRYMKEHLDEDLSLQRVAEQVHLHPNYLSSLIKEKAGVSYSSMLLKFRMEHAEKLLLESNTKIQVIAANCGFRDSGYFIKVFKKEYNKTPDNFRKVYNHVT